MKAEITPYLFFGGKCEQAIHFYRDALDAKVEMMMRFEESPEAMPPGILQPGFEKKIMHATFQLLGIRIMASDGCDDKVASTEHPESYKLAITVSSEPEAHRVFDALAAHGTIQMPLMKTFWSPCYGMVRDQFGIGWMVMVTTDN